MLYDSTAVPERYHRSRALTSTDTDRWVRLVQQVLPCAESPLLLDLGCGTGRFTVPLAEHLGVSVIWRRSLTNDAAGGSPPDPFTAHHLSRGPRRSDPLGGKRGSPHLYVECHPPRHEPGQIITGNVASAPTPGDCVHPKLLSRKSVISSLSTVVSRRPAHLPHNAVAAYGAGCAFHQQRFCPAIAGDGTSRDIL